MCAPFCRWPGLLLSLVRCSRVQFRRSGQSADPQGVPPTSVPSILRWRTTRSARPTNRLSAALFARKLTCYRINKVASSTGSARNQMKRMWLFARYGIIGLRLDDVPSVRAQEHERPHTQTFCLCSFVVPRAQIVQVAVAVPSGAPDFPERHNTRRGHSPSAGLSGIFKVREGP